MMCVRMWLSTGDNRTVGGLKNGVNCFHHKGLGSISVQSMWVCGAQSGSGIGFVPSPAFSPCQDHSTIASRSFIHLTLTFYILRN
jgi:hypothetical protein